MPRGFNATAETALDTSISEAPRMRAKVRFTAVLPDDESLVRSVLRSLRSVTSHM
jgi:hypothetical protein